MSSPETKPPPRPYIEFEHVSKSFGSLCVLDDVSFAVYPGETLCILGRSGVGKSVSLHSIMGFLKPDSGRIVVAYEDITDFAEVDLERIRKKVTMVFQSGALFDSLSVRENVAFPLRERGALTEDQIFQIVDGLLEMVGVKQMGDLLPSELSTGMRRSVAIARALSAEPEAILYDEPTTMVDPLMAQLLGDLIQKLKLQLKLTSIVVTHDMRLAEKLADRIVFLHEAKAIFFGTYAEMQQSQSEIIRSFLELDTLALPVSYRTKLDSIQNGHGTRTTYRTRSAATSRHRAHRRRRLRQGRRGQDHDGGESRHRAGQPRLSYRPARRRHLWAQRAPDGRLGGGARRWSAKTRSRPSRRWG